MIIFNNIINKILVSLFIIFFLGSCETIGSSYDFVKSKILSTEIDIDSEESLEPNQEEVVSDNKENLDVTQQNEISQNDNSKRKVSDDNEDLVIEQSISEEELDSAEVEDVQINDIETKINEDLKEFSSSLKKKETVEMIETEDNIQNNKGESIIESDKFVATKLTLKNKIQFKIATINFNSGSSTIDIEGLKKIKKVLRIANEKNAIVKIVGHASTRTKDMDILKHKMVNFIISDKRTQSVASVFVKNKFPLEKLITEAVSDSKPLFHEVMPAGTYANQRTEIYLIY